MNRAASARRGRVAAYVRPVADAVRGNGASAPGSDAPGQGLTVLGAAFLGVGAMVGAGIFALLGQAGTVAGAAVWISFLLAGGIAALLGYVVVKLGVRYPSKGGFVAYLVEAFGNGRLVGITSWLLYFVVLIVTAMVAVAFGAYGTSLFFGDDPPRPPTTSSSASSSSAWRC